MKYTTADRRSRVGRVHKPEAARAVDAAVSIASAYGLVAEDALVLHNSNKLTLRLSPCDIVARVAPAAEQNARFEVEIARRLAESGAPVAALDRRIEPGVHERDGFVLTFWTFYEPAGEVSPRAYAEALDRLHQGMRELDIQAPHATDRVDEALAVVRNPVQSPALGDADRTLLGSTLQELRQVVRNNEQLLHGEPHPGNLLATSNGPVFIDFETCCRGPVEFDLAHAPDDVADHYPGLDQDLLRDCRLLVLAVITAWRWDRADQFPDGPQLGKDWLAQLRRASNQLPQITD